MTDSIQNLIDEANNYILNSQYEKALTPLEKALEENPENQEALKNLGLCYYNLKNNTTAQEYFSKALSIDPNDATSLYFVASINLLNMDNKTAKEQFEKVLELRPEYQDAYKNLGIVHFNMKNMPEAVAILEKGLEYSKTSAEYVRLLASAYIVNRQNQQAKELMEELLPNLDQKGFELYNLLGSACLGLKDNKNAHKYYLKALEINPNNTVALRALKLLDVSLNEEFQKYKELIDNKSPIEDVIEISNILYEQKNINEAIGFLAYAVKKGYKDTAIYYQLSILYEAKGEVIEALKWLKKILTTSKPTKDIELKIANLFLSAGKLKEAFSLLNKLTKKHPYDPEVYYKYAQAYIDYDEKIKAEEYLKKVIDMDSDQRLSALAHKDMGCIYLAQNQMQYAKEEFEMAYEKMPEDDIICYEYASYHFITGDYEKALEYYHKALKINPYQDDYKVAVGLLYNNLKRYMDTINLLTPIMPKLTKMPKIAYPLAVAFYEIGKYDPALRLFVLYCEISQDLEAFNYLALTYEKLGQYQDSINILDKILKTFPDNINVLITKAKCLHKLEKYKESEEIYIDILSKLSEYEDAIIGLVDLYKDSNQINKAKDLVVRLDEEKFSDEAIKIFHSLKQEQ